MADTHSHDLDKWRRSILSKRPSREYVEGFQVADMDNGAMWDLLKLLTAYDPSRRLTAAAALRHPAFGTGLVGRLNVLLSSVGNATDKVTVPVLGRSISLQTVQLPGMICGCHRITAVSKLMYKHDLPQLHVNACGFESQSNGCGRVLGRCIRLSSFTSKQQICSHLQRHLSSAQDSRVSCRL